MSNQSSYAGGFFRTSSLLASILILPFAASTAFAQDAGDDDEAIDEIVTVGSQIRGASISDALAVSVVDASEIEALGVDSGDELLEFMAEQGQNFFAESENISGGVNSARGDIGAYNLRNLGTGNTLVLLNGRRLVNAASYQTELVGGSFIPVNTVNSQSLPVFGLERVEVLRDGASAIYGADAVAGVVNYVMKTDFEGLSIRARYSDHESLPSTNHKLTLEWGKNFNDGRTNLSVFGSYYHRDPINSQDDPKWADDDYRRYISENNPFFGDTSFRRSSANGEFGQFDVRDSVASIDQLTDNGITDGNGEFVVYPAGTPNCTFVINANTCGAFDSSSNATMRHNLNTNRDLYSDLDRFHLFAFLNHDFGNGLESFTEVSAYMSDTLTQRHRSTRLSAVAKYRVGAQNYYNPLGPCGSPNRLPFELIGDDSNGGVPCTGLELEIDNYGWTAAPRIVDNDGETYRVLQGFRGELGAWDWEAAASWSRAEKEDITDNRISNTLMQAALNDPTPNAYNPFNGGIDTNIEQAVIKVTRNNYTELSNVDFKMSNAELFEMPAGPVAFLAGIDWREEKFDDDRDPRLDGTITFTDNAGNGFPIVSDVMNSSPTLDSSGSRDVLSLFTELQIPLHETLDIQLAARYEDFSDIGDTTVGKIAFGWRPVERLLVRGSWSEAYRVPNLVTVNESGVARSNTVDDFVCFFVDPNEDTLDCSQGVQRAAGGSSDLTPEESTNTSYGIVWDMTDALTLTLDFWSIEKDDTIGLFGEDNHTALDLLYRIEAGNSNCASQVGNPAVIRDDPALLDPLVAQLFTDAGICPAGEAQRVNDVYKNLDTRTVKGYDIGVYYNKDTAVGDFSFTYVSSYLDEYTQKAGGDAQVLIDAQEAGVLPPDVIVVGFADLVRQNGNPRWKHTARLNWRQGDWGAWVSGAKVSEVVETRPGLGSDGSKWILDSMATYNAAVDYRFDAFGDVRARARLGIVNLTDARAPLSSNRFGYFSDVHRDLGRSYYVDLRLDF